MAIGGLGGIFYLYKERVFNPAMGIAKTEMYLIVTLLRSEP